MFDYNELKEHAQAIKEFCSGRGMFHEEKCPFFRGWKREDGVDIVICELNKGMCSPCNWELDK